MSVIRFIHTSDMHLGSLLHVTGNLPEEIRDISVDATFEAFERICDAAVKYDVDFVVISGDLYDREARSIKAVHFFNEQCKKLDEYNIPVYLIAGNHDPLLEQREIIDMPKNVYTFKGNGPEVHIVTDKHNKSAARVVGQSYQRKAESRKMHLGYNAENDGMWNIALLHTQLSPHDHNYVPCSLNELKEKEDIHYWALGHIHQCRMLNGSYPVIGYSGIPQGRDFGEEGLGGCLLVTLEENTSPTVSFIPVSPVVWKRVEVYIDEDPEDEPKNITDLEERICGKAKDILESHPGIPEGIGIEEDINQEEDSCPEYVEGFIIQWIIKGKGMLHDTLMAQEEESTQHLTEVLRERFVDGSPFIWTESVVFRTEKPMPIETIKNMVPVFEEIEKVIDLYLKDEEYRDEMMDSFGAIWEQNTDHENVSEVRFQMDDYTYETILGNAKQLLLDKLLEKRD